MKIMTGDAAVRASVPGTHILDTADGIILFPDAGTDGSTGAGTCDRSGAITCTRAVRYRPGYAGHLPEFWPADAAEACKMARSAKLYAGTYRTPVLLRLPAEIRNSRISVIPRKRTMTERRSTDYIMDRKKQEEMARQDPEEHPDLQPYSTYSNWLEKYEALYDLADQTRQMLGALAVLCVLQFIVIVFLIFEVVRS